MIKLLVQMYGYNQKFAILLFIYLFILIHFFLFSTYIYMYYNKFFNQLVFFFLEIIYHIAKYRWYTLVTFYFVKLSC